MRTKHLLAAFAVAILAGCFSTEDPGMTGTRKDTGNDSTKIVYVLDSVLLNHKLDSLRRLDSLKIAGDSAKVGPNGIGGVDDFPNKYLPTLIELAGKMRQLPTPMGTRYGSTPAPTGSKSAAAACNGSFEVASIHDKARGIVGVDTISYYDSLGVPHCDWRAGISKETHARYVLDLNAGESWEKIDIRITEDNTLPRHLTHGTGRMRLTSGLEFIIESWDVDMIVMYDSTGTYIRDAHLNLAWKDGYTFKMDLVKARPFNAPDLFPSWGSQPGGGKILSGPIMKGTLTVGYIDLYADKTVAIRDWNGAAVSPR